MDQPKNPMRLYIDAEMGSAFERLAANVAVLMPPGDYGFSKKFAWLNDRCGVS